MICEKCGKNIATTHIETYVNGKQSSMNLCSACAAEEGAANPFQMGLGGLLGSIFGDALGAAPAGMPNAASAAARLRRLPAPAGSAAQIAIQPSMTG